jgi:heparan-alpha-glucosaminide N-acetyltransferase
MSVVSKSERLGSLDAFRGAVIASMLFVNLLGENPNTPGWLLHAEPYTDRYTFTDLVFPGFVFIVGVSIPLALHRRGTNLLRQIARILGRGVALLAVGVVIEFHGELSEVNTGMRELYWMCLFYLGIFLSFQIYPAADTEQRLKLYRRLRMVGFALMGVLILLYRGETLPDGTIPFLQHQWWGILGLIGWAYMFASLVYLAVGGGDMALLGSLSLMIAMYIGYRHDVLEFLPSVITDVIDPGALGTLGANATAGALVGNLLLKKDLAPHERLKAMLWLALGLYLGGMLIRPLHGISKIGGTDSYVLVASGLNCAAFALFHALIDVWKAWRPPALLLRVGQNPLLAYMMPSLWTYFVALFGLKHVWQTLAFPFFHSPWSLMCPNAIAVALFFLGVVYGLSKLGIRLQL